MDNIDKQEDINKQFEEISKDLEKLQEMNEDLENPKEMGDSNNNNRRSANTWSRAWSSFRTTNKNRPASSSNRQEKRCSRWPSRCWDQMQQQQQEQQQEDMRALSQLLDNLLKLSLDQEDLIYELQQTKAANPRYVELMNEQQRIRKIPGWWKTTCWH